MDLGSVASVVVPVLVGLLTYFATRGKTASEAKQFEIATTLATIKEDRDNDRKRLDASEAREMILMDYIYKLRNHIAEGSKPPPPEWPPGLFTIGRED